MELPPNMTISLTFNVNDIYEYHSTLNEDLMTIFPKEEDTDVAHNEKVQEI